MVTVSLKLPYFLPKLIIYYFKSIKEILKNYFINFCFFLENSTFFIFITKLKNTSISILWVKINIYLNIKN